MALNLAPSIRWTLHEVALDANIFASFGADISKGKYGYMDSMLVIRQCKIAMAVKKVS